MYYSSIVLSEWDDVADTERSESIRTIVKVGEE